MTTNVLEALRAATAGLLYQSETDAPFEAFLWEAAPNAPASVVTLAKLPPEMPCRTSSLEAFLSTQEELPELGVALEALLSGIVVYRFGDVEPLYFVVGTDAFGRLAGLKTVAVET